MELALFEPEIPQNTGTLIRLCACFKINFNIIEPASFILDDKRLRRSGMDYLEHVKIRKFPSFQNFRSSTSKRIILLDTKATKNYTAFQFKHDDIIMVGRESSGVPEDVFNSCDEKLLIPMEEGYRSLNVAISAAMVIGEALRQTKWIL